MPMRFNCEACTSRIKVPDGTVGKLVKCPGCGHAQRVPQESDEESSQPVVASEPVRARKSSKPALAETKQSKHSAEVSKESTASKEVVDDVDVSPSDHDADSSPQENEELVEENVADAISGTSVSPDESDALDELDQLDDREEEDAPVAIDEFPANTDAPIDDEPESPEFQQSIEAVEETLQEDTGQEEVGQDEEPVDAPIEAEVDSYSDEAVAVAEAWPADLDTNTHSDAEEEAVEEHYPVATPVAHARAPSRTDRRERSRITAATGGTALLIVGWMLRVLAVMSVAGAVKILLLMSDAGSSVIDMLFVAPFLLGFVATFWAVGELSLTARGLPRDN